MRFHVRKSAFSEERTMPDSATGIEDGVVETGSFSTHFITAGEGQPLILIHGGGAGADAKGNWAKIIPLFVRAGYRAVAYDLVGFGQSSAPDPAGFSYDQESRNQQLMSLLDALNIGKASIIGNSMGGATALGLAMRNPERIEKMVLMASGGVNRDTGTGLAPLIDYDFSIDGMRKIVAALTNPEFLIDEAMVRYRHALSSAPDVRRAYGAIMGWIKQQGGLHYEDEDIRAVKTATLVITGKQDQVIPMADSIKMMNLIETSSGYFIPNCGHWAMIEYPELFARITIDFLRH
jgi:pimeloyl-ACP methyl ester carboxylesterase